MTTTPAGMSPATFKTAHESLGITTETLAGLLGVGASRIWDYEDKARRIDVPEHAADTMRDLVNTFDEAADAMAKHATKARAIGRHTSLQAFYEAYPHLEGWGAGAQAQLIIEVQRRTKLPVNWSEVAR
jgi:hypothetical protein